MIQSDVSRPENVDALYDRVMKDFPAINVLINNAGVMRLLNLHKEDSSLLDLTSEIDTNLKGPMWMVRKFLPHLKQLPSAAIVNVSSAWPMSRCRSRPSTAPPRLRFTRTPCRSGFS